MKSIKVLFVSQEITPYMPESDISCIGRNLPQGIREKGKEIRTFMPRWGCINERRNQLHEVIRLSGMNLVISETDHPLIIKVASIQSARMQVYFIDNEDYFQRRGMFSDDDGVFYPDNDERAIFFARGVLETVKKLRWSPDIVHCHGWFSSLIPILLKKAYKDDPVFTKSQIIYSIYDDGFDNPLSPTIKNKLLVEGITKKDLEPIKEPNYENLIQLAIKYSDGIIFGGNHSNKNLVEYINSSQKPVIEIQTDNNYIDATNSFYDTILNSRVYV